MCNFTFKFMFVEQLFTQKKKKFKIVYISIEIIIFFFSLKSPKFVIIDIDVTEEVGIHDDLDDILGTASNGKKLCKLKTDSSSQIG